MNAAVRAAIEARISELDTRIQQSDEIIASYDQQLSSLTMLRDAEVDKWDALEAEHNALTAALPEVEEESE
ncbi:hypothetical protein [Microbacterium sp. LWH10-1.2]|uniref:hypothetical protein n=1 Tax=Microbacterium sp. LWH10-1.2 TaxID=3135255 RepID=UPI00313A49B9